ncbi:MAG: hypothetical protein K0Q66_404 [Chitinophagaceae bacterium]|nr:hypothetical protein [Chitinophagaceae bacterium]
MIKAWKKYIGSLFVSNRWHAALTACIVLFVIRFFIPWLGIIPYAALLVLGVLALADYFFLYRFRGVSAVRSHAERLSNGDDNPVQIHFENHYPFTVTLDVIDEVPHQFQKRDVHFHLVLAEGESKYLKYQLRPVKRGEYEFGYIRLFCSTSIGLFKRRLTVGQPVNVPVYPSYIQMRRYQLMAISNRLSEVGVKKVRSLGHTMEFEQIKEYVTGDDYRTVNWKATARKGQLMVNNYTDEKSQQIYCIIDKSRVMRMPFEGLSLLDYSVNASLVLSNVALLKQDKAGIITFAEKISSFLTADRKLSQMQAILELLYKQKSRYLESDFEKLYIQVKRKINQRSLLVLFTNFESLSGMRRQLPYLRKLAADHLLVTVFFENTELEALLNDPAGNLKQVYTKAVAEQFASEKQSIVAELQQHGIMTILTPPQNLTVNALNKYLEIKARQLL